MDKVSEMNPGTYFLALAFTLIIALMIYTGVQKKLDRPTTA